MTALRRGIRLPARLPNAMKTSSLKQSQRHDVPKVALVCDLLEENWASMDLVALMLEQGLEQFHGSLEATRLCPPMRRRLSRPNHTHRKLMFNADRVFNRLWDYPRWLEAHCDRFDLFHVVDHSYFTIYRQTARS